MVFLQGLNYIIGKSIHARPLASQTVSRAVPELVVHTILVVPASLTIVPSILDVYKWNANSAIAANTFFRSWVGAGFPMFAVPMFNKLGVPWAMSLLAFLCVALFPVPILFFIYGEKIRKLSKYSPS